MNHVECIKELQEVQETETDNREKAHEADLFLNKRDGQWEAGVAQKFVNRPRYTFDECNPIIDGIMGDIESQDFGIKVDPASGEATKDIARILSGMIRTIQNISKPSANFIYNHSARIMIGGGFDAWRVVTDFRDDDSFQQDLMIKHVPNAIDCVWFDGDAQLPDMSDSSKAWVLTSTTYAAYKKKYPKGSGMSVGQSIAQQTYSHKKPHEVIIGEYLHKVKRERELALMTNGSVYEVNEDFQKIYDELKESGIEVHATRTRPYYTVYQRLFDGNDWLTSDKESVFCYIPVVPLYGNFRISENKVIYWGLIEKLMDPQRIINYSESRKIEEGALAPKGKVWMTKEQASSDSVKATLRTLNTNNDPVQFYDHVEGQNSPSFVGAPASNPGLVETTQTAQNFIQRTSGTYDEDRGTAPPRRSGIAIEKLQVKSDAPKRKWISALEIAIQHTAEIITKAIPKVYTTPQMVSITGEDGSTESISIFQRVKDKQSGEVVVLNDLNQGKYSVVCTAGPAFKTRQGETVAAITDYATIDPSILQLGGDVLLQNINSPGIATIAERKRRQMLIAGLIPPEQTTDEEKEILAKAQENKSPVDEANLMLAQAEMTKAQAMQAQTALKGQIEQLKIQLKQAELAMKAQKDRDATMIESIKQLNAQIKLQAETLKLVREAMGVDTIVTPTGVRAFEQQAVELTRSIATQ